MGAGLTTSEMLTSDISLWDSKKTGQPLRVIPDDVAEKTASEIENYSNQGDKHLEELKKILDYEGSDYAS